jgi:hypothetical protein
MHKKTAFIMCRPGLPAAGHALTLMSEADIGREALL